MTRRFQGLGTLVSKSLNVLDIFFIIDCYGHSQLNECPGSIGQYDFADYSSTSTIVSVHSFSDMRSIMYDHRDVKNEGEELIVNVKNVKLLHIV